MNQGPSTQNLRPMNRWKACPAISQKRSSAETACSRKFWVHRTKQIKLLRTWGIPKKSRPWLERCRKGVCKLGQAENPILDPDSIYSHNLTPPPLQSTWRNCKNKVWGFKQGNRKEPGKEATAILLAAGLISMRKVCKGV